MLLRVPQFYNDFHCIAQRCSDSCCIGWEIDVDERTQAKYSKLAALPCNNHKAEFFKKLLANIEDGHFKLTPGDRCPFLQQDGLCELIRNLGCNGTDVGPDGESVLCDICREHPRFVEVYGDIMEKGIGLCCEEGVRLLLTFGISFTETEIDDDPDEITDDVREARDAIFEERQHIFDLLADTSKTLNERLLEVLDFAEKVSGVNFGGAEENGKSETLDNCDKPLQEEEHPQSTSAIPNTLKIWLEVLNQGESFGPAWDEAYKRMIRKSKPLSCHREERSDEAIHSLFTDDDGTRIVAYLIFRYYAKSLFDGDSLGKVQFAIFFWIILRNFGAELSFPDNFNKTCDSDSTLSQKINAIKLLSKQTEYSEEVMEILAEHFYQDEAFCIESFKTQLVSLDR